MSFGLVNQIAHDTINFVHGDKINPESPAYKELQELKQLQKDLNKRLKNMEISFQTGEVYKNKEQYLEAVNKTKKILNSVVNDIQRITGDVKSTTVKGYSYDNDPKATPIKPETNLGKANIVLADPRWGQLSNLADHTFTYEGREYRSVEHAYQANKSGKFHEPTYRAYFDKPEARKIRGPMPKSFDFKVQLMEDLYRQMLSENPDVVNLLKETEGFNITHQLRNTDDWTTEMPRILTKLRDELINPVTEVKPQTFETIKRYDVDILRANPDKIYIFGDNEERWGKKNQSIIRDEPNAFGIATKKRPSMDDDAFFTDDEFEANKKIIDEDIAKIKADGRPIVFPEDGIGTGLAGLENKAPRTYEYLMGEIEKLKGGTGITPSPTKMIEVEGDFDTPAAAYRARTGTTGGTVGDITIDFVTQTTYDRGAGSGATKKSTQSGGKIYQPVIVDEAGLIKNQDNIDKLAKVIAEHLTTGKTVNIAGHGAYKSPRTGFTKPMDQEIINNELNKVFDKVLEIIGDQPITGKVITGGQSGYDLAGSRAAASHGIPNEAYYSSTQAEGGALFRTPEGEDIDNLEEFSKRFNRYGPGGMPPIDTPEFGEWYAKNLEGKSDGEIMEVIAKQTGLDSKALKAGLGAIPGYALVPLEQLAEQALKSTKAGPFMKNLIRYELYMFGAMIVAGATTFAMDYASNKFKVPRVPFGNMMPGAAPNIYGNYEQELPLTQEELDFVLFQDEEGNDFTVDDLLKAEAMGNASKVIQGIAYLMPSYWLDEWIYKNNPELREDYEDKKFFSEGGWRATFAQTAGIEKAIKNFYASIMGLTVGNNE